MQTCVHRICPNDTVRQNAISTVNANMKDIIKIEVDKQLGMTEVYTRVPGFMNFGQRLGDIERQSYEAVMADDEENEDPELMAELEADIEDSMKDMKASMESIGKAAKDMPDGPQKEAMALLATEVARLGEEAEDEEDCKDETQETEEDRFTYDLEVLRVSLSDEASWDTAVEERVDQFLADWQEIRPVVLEATFAYYSESHPELLQVFGEDELRMPKPDSPDIVADLFCISAVYLHEDGSVGLGGPCTWDEEHGWGVRIRDRRVVAIGYESDAFE